MSNKSAFLQPPAVYLLALVIIMAVAIGLLLRRAAIEREQKQQVVLQNEILDTERALLITQLDSLEAAYVHLSAECEELREEFNQQAGLIRSLRSRISRDSGQLAAYKQQVEALTEQFDVHLKQAEELLALNESLKQENTQLKQVIGEANNMRAQLEKENLRLSGQLDAGSMLRVTGITVFPLVTTSRGVRETLRIRRADRLRICLEIAENVLAGAEHHFYFQLTGPDGYVLSGTNNEPLLLGGVSEPVSLTESIQYNIEQKEYCAVLEHLSGFEKGQHQLRVFYRNQEIWRGQFELR